MSIQDAAGNYAAFTYDNAGRLIQAGYPDGYTNYFNYDLLGELTNQTDTAGVSVTNRFNNQGLLYETFDAGGIRSALALMSRTGQPTVGTPTASASP